MLIMFKRLASRLKRLFSRLFSGAFDVYSGHVLDKVRFDGKLILEVEGNAWKMLSDIEEARNAAQSLKADSTEEEKKAVAMRFATAIFGGKQAEMLYDFYNGDTGSVLGVCGQYISKRLIKRISSVQKKQK